MRVREVMTRAAEVVRPDSSLQEAARKMKDLDVGFLPVCDGERLVGTLTDRDIAVRAAAEGKDPKTTRARDTMTPEVLYCFEDQDVAEAARIMKDKQVRRLPVLNRDRRLVGILSLGDVATQTDEEVAGNTLEAVSQPSTPNR